MSDKKGVLRTAGRGPSGAERNESRDTPCPHPSSAAEPAHNHQKNGMNFPGIIDPDGITIDRLGRVLPESNNEHNPGKPILSVSALRALAAAARQLQERLDDPPSGDAGHSGPSASAATLSAGGGASVDRDEEVDRGS